VEQDQDDITALLREAEALCEVRRYGDAIQRATDAASREANNAYVYRVWARALLGSEQYREAERVANQAIWLAPANSTGYRQRAVALCGMVRTASGAERTRLAGEATNAAREAVRLAPYDANCHLGLADALSLSKDAAAANEALQRAIRMAPNSASTWVTASVVALGVKNWSTAIEASQRALRLDPNNYAALNNLGVALRGAGRGNEGTRVLARAAAVEPDRTTARLNLSRRGLNISRIAVLVLFFPLVFVRPAGELLFILVAIGSNILIARRPDLVMNLERWAAPLALFFARRSPEEETATTIPSSSPSTIAEKEWSALEGRQRVRTPYVILVAVTLWLVAAIGLAAGLTAPGYGHLIGGGVAVAVAVPAFLLTRTVMNRKS
jgi:tetratricopeptide (TPR) repeat protein